MTGAHTQGCRLQGTVLDWWWGKCIRRSGTEVTLAISDSAARNDSGGSTKFPQCYVQSRPAVSPPVLRSFGLEELETGDWKPQSRSAQRNLPLPNTSARHTSTAVRRDEEASTNQRCITMPDYSAGFCIACSCHFNAIVKLN